MEQKELELPVATPGVCPERIKLLRLFMGLLSDLTKIAYELDYVTEVTHDSVRHGQLLEKWRALYARCAAAERAYERHCAQHGCPLPGGGGSRQTDRLTFQTDPLRNSHPRGQRRRTRTSSQIRNGLFCRIGQRAAQIRSGSKSAPAKQRVC
jgi:hypothetical protein